MILVPQYRRADGLPSATHDSFGNQRVFGLIYTVFVTSIIPPYGADPVEPKLPPLFLRRFVGIGPVRRAGPCAGRSLNCYADREGFAG